MPLHRTTRRALGVLLVAGLTSCAQPAPQAVRVTPSPSTPPGMVAAPPRSSTSTYSAGWAPPGAAIARSDALRVEEAAFVIAVAHNEAARVFSAAARSTPARASARSVPATVPTPALGSGTAAGDYHTWADWPLWHAVGLCEQQGSGQWDTYGDGIAWGGSPAGGLPGSAYPGGLGLSVDFWRQFAPEAGVTVTNGAYATPAEQIRVARAGSHNGTRMGGWSSWPGCVQRRMNG